MDQAQTRMNAYWTARAASYDDDQRRPGRADLERAVWTDVWSSALPAGVLDVLDVGTGSGAVAHLLAQAGHRVTGVDLAAGMLERAALHAGGSPWPRFRTGDAVDPPFGDGSFDAVVNRYLVWTLRDPERAVTAWYRLLRPGGVLAVVDGAWFPDGLHEGVTGEFRFWYDETVRARLPMAEGDTGDRLPDLLRQNGFVRVESRPLDRLLELDREHGAAPGHRPTLQFLTTAHRPA